MPRCRSIPVKDFTPVAMIGVSPFVLIGATQVSAPTLKDFVTLAKAKPGSLSYAWAGTGTLAHLAGELFKRQGRHRRARALSRQARSR